MNTPRMDTSCAMKPFQAPHMIAITANAITAMSIIFITAMSVVGLSLQI
jgi:hypothetical protein